MKRFKLICSAIAALSMLALAGCDHLKIPGEKIEFNYIVQRTITLASDVSSIDLYFYPQFGTWEWQASLNGIPQENGTKETVPNDGPDGPWWNVANRCESITIKEGETLEFTVKCIEGEVGIINLVFEGNDGKDYIDLRPDTDQIWGDLVANSSSVVSADFDGYKKDVTYTFTLEWADDVLTYTFL